MINPELDPNYPLGKLSDDMMRGIVALGESLAARESVPPVEFFVDFVNRETETRAGILREYQIAALLLDTTATELFGQGGNKRQFADLSHPQRDQVLRRLLWQYPAGDKIRRKIEKLAASRDALAMRVYVVAPMIQGYYRSSYGWAVVGYDSFPGRPPVDPRAYTLPPDPKKSLS